MPRATNNPASRKRRKKVLNQAKGFWGLKSKVYRRAREAVDKSLKYAYRDRKTKKRQFRRLWIMRINAAIRQEGMSYSEFINKLAKANIKLNRKALADMAAKDIVIFKKLVNLVNIVKGDNIQAV